MGSVGRGTSAPASTCPPRWKFIAQEGQESLYTAVDNDGTRYNMPAFTHPDHTPDTWHHWPATRSRRSPGPPNPGWVQAAPARL
jgi:hypothetical protein